MHHNKQRIYFKNIYETDFCDCIKRNAKGTHLYSRWAYKQGGLYPAGLISGIIYNHWQMNGLISGGGLIRGGGGALKWDFTVKIACVYQQIDIYFGTVMDISK